MSAGVLCYRCYRSGHYARDCQDKSSSVNSRGCRGNGIDGSPEGKFNCFNCNQSGHIARYCKSNKGTCYK